MAEAKRGQLRYAVVTGANKGIGFETVRQLASNGITVVLAARDLRRGLQALEKLKDSGFKDQVVFHQLDVADPASVASLADFIKTQFGKLDILVNNAGISGYTVDDVDALKASINSGGGEAARTERYKLMTQTSELTDECLHINYHGAKTTTEALLPFLHLSDSPRIVNVASSWGKLSNIPSDWAKGVLSDTENLTEERVDEVLAVFRKDFKEGSFESKGWPPSMSAYRVSKAALNAYTRILAEKYPRFRVNSVCPGFVKTDMTFNANGLPVEEGAASVVRLALLHNDGPTGLFFFQSEVTDF